MSSTPRAKDDSIFYQNRYASSAEFERGLLGNLVAKRTSLLSDKSDREIIWFIQYLSHQQGGISALVADLIEKFPARIEEDGLTLKDMLEQECELHTVIEEGIKRLCLNPGSDLKKGTWGFKKVIPSIKEIRNEYIKPITRGFKTALGLKVEEVLDYTAFSRGLTLVEGEARTGKSFAARAWCEQRPGIARYVEVATGNDDGGFFRGLGRGLGLGNLSQYKVTDLRERVESVLLAGDLLLILDEAQRLWPQRNLRYGFPSRITWVMTMANARVPIAMVSTPQFLTTQKAVEKNGWNSAQLTGRIGHYEPLPTTLELDDLMAVGKAVLPEASKDVLRALGAYARTSARYLAAIDSISNRARYLAMKAGRGEATAGDVRTAMSESVIPADTKLTQALEKTATTNAHSLKRFPTPVPVGTREGSTLPGRQTTPGVRLPEIQPKAFD